MIAPRFYVETPMLKRLLTAIFLSSLLIAQSGIVAPISYPEITGDASAHQIATTGSCRTVQIIAPSGNAAVVRIGDSTTTSSKGLPVAAGAGLFLPPLDSDQRESVQQHFYNLSAIYYYAASNDKLDFVCFK